MKFEVEIKFKMAAISLVYLLAIGILGVISLVVASVKSQKRLLLFCISSEWVPDAFLYLQVIICLHLKQIVQTLTRCRILWRMIWVYTACQCLFYGTLSINGVTAKILFSCRLGDLVVEVSALDLQAEGRGIESRSNENI